MCATVDCQCLEYLGFITLTRAPPVKSWRQPPGCCICLEILYEYLKWTQLLTPCLKINGRSLHLFCHMRIIYEISAEKNIMILKTYIQNILYSNSNCPTIKTWLLMLPWTLCVKMPIFKTLNLRKQKHLNKFLAQVLRCRIYHLKLSRYAICSRPSICNVHSCSSYIRLKCSKQ